MLVSDNLHETRKPYTLIQFDFGKYIFLELTPSKAEGAWSSTSFLRSYI
jgi:hypothetical protein